MLRDTAVARVKQMLGFKTNLDNEIVQAMIEHQEDLERSSELPFFLRKKFNGSFVTVDGTQTITAPADFIREWDDDPLTITVINSDGTSYQQELIKDTPAFLKLRFPEPFPVEPTTIPRGYARIDKTFYLYPIPRAIYTFDGSYYGKDQPLTNNIENAWLRELPLILVARAGLFLASGLRDQSALTSLSALNDIMTAKLHLMTTADDQAGAKPVMGGED